MKAIFLVGTGSLVDSVLRYLISGWVFRFLDKPWFPVGIFAVKLDACLGIGFLRVFAEQRRIFEPEIRFLLVVGLLGGFTTFSAFIYETASLADDTRLAAALPNIALRVVVGLLVIWLGVKWRALPLPLSHGFRFKNFLIIWNLG